MCLGGRGNLKGSRGQPATVAQGLDLIRTLTGTALYCLTQGCVASALTREFRGSHVTLPGRSVTVGHPPWEPLLKQTLSRVWPAWASEGQVQCPQLCELGCPLEHLPGLCQASFRLECKAAGRPGALTSDPESDGTL